MLRALEREPALLTDDGLDHDAKTAGVLAWVSIAGDLRALVNAIRPEDGEPAVPGYTLSPNSAMAAAAVIGRAHDAGGPGHDDGDACAELRKRLARHAAGRFTP
jgi:hypothetical protein